MLNKKINFRFPINKIQQSHKFAYTVAITLLC